MKINKTAITKICQWLESKGLPVTPEELRASEVSQEFRYLLSLYSSDRNLFVFPGERITIYDSNGEPSPSVLWNLNQNWRKNLSSSEESSEELTVETNKNFRSSIS